MTHVGALSGAELALWRLVKHLDPKRYQPIVLTFADGPLVDRLQADGIPTVVVPLPQGVASARRGSLLRTASLRGAGSAASFIPRLTRSLRGLDIDVLHAHSLKADLISVAVSPLVRVPLVWHVHDRISADYLPPRTARIVRTLAQRVPKHVVVNSQATLRTLMPLGQGWTVAYPGLDEVEFERGTRPSCEGGPIVGILGRIGPTKGQDVFLRAAAEVLVRHPTVQFRIIGSALFGEHGYETELRRLSHELGINGSVEFTGFVDDPASALRALTVCVHASPVPEPFGQVIVEAMAAGVPTVVADAGGASEIVRDGEEVLARLAEPGSVRELADGIGWLLDHPDDALAMSDRAYWSVRRRFDIARTARAVMAAWDLVLGSADRNLVSDDLAD